MAKQAVKEQMSRDDTCQFDSDAMTDDKKKVMIKQFNSSYVKDIITSTVEQHNGLDDEESIINLIRD